MNEAEAEGVLLALGPQLEWEPGEWVSFGRGTGAYYQVDEWIFQESSFAICHSDGRAIDAELVFKEGDYREGALLTFSTLADAKAACERHYATGKWEIEHFAEVPE